jgi:hypothetical protein
MAYHQQHLERDPGTDVVSDDLIRRRLFSDPPA